MSKNLEIRLLDNRLANQIAAGEVVERPSSVIKELIENSIDAGATRIEVDIERGGTRLMRVTDDGSGIPKDELGLALTRHATSKISSIEDLMAIRSLGFRGEALASVSAVSKLTLTSRTQSSELAWQAIAQGRDMAIDIQPAAATVGTRIEVADLFFNTPARQKFLRTEKTEFNHIEENFKRHALANSEISFVLKHNHKIVKRVPASSNPEQYLKRLAVICGKPFSENCVAFECQHESIQLHGWLGKPSFHRSESDIQYVFINGRPVRDKTLNHAIRQAYDGLIPSGRMPAYVIFLTMDPREVDVNVHPTKYEVRFEQQRLVHDLLAKSMAEALADYDVELALDANFQQEERLFLSSIKATSNKSNLGSNQFSGRDNFSNNAYLKPSIGINRQVNEMAASSEAYFTTELGNEVSNLPTKNLSVQSLLPIGKNFWLAHHTQKTIAIDGVLLLEHFLFGLLQEQPQGKQQETRQPIRQPASQAILFPQVLPLNAAQLEDYRTHYILERLGFIYEAEKEAGLIIKQIPVWLSWMKSSWIFEQLPHWLEASHVSDKKLARDISLSFTLIAAPLIDFIYRKSQNEILQTNCYKEISLELIQDLFI